MQRLDAHVRSARVRLPWLLGWALLVSSCYWLRAREPALPALSAGAHAGVLRCAGRTRTYLSYVPKTRVTPTPLVVLLHGSTQTGETFRRATGYAFDRLADQHGFVAVYPDAVGARWNDCRRRGHYEARKRGIDDVGFVVALVDELARRAAIDPTRVFLVGYSNGGQLSFRVALEAPARVAAIATFGASLPTPPSWVCGAFSTPISLLLVNGVNDRINPFEGGRVDVFGFASRGRVRSALDTARYFARLSALPKTAQRTFGEPQAPVDEHTWSDGGAHVVTLLAVHGSGHVVPGPHAAFPRILGGVNASLDGPAAAWDFFARRLAWLSEAGPRSTAAP